MLAYLISAYRDPEHLARLVRALDFEGDFYVHIDARADAERFRRVLPRGVSFVKSRPVNWGGWNQVLYQYELLRAALRSGKEYSHLVCLSGQDYPLWGNRAIHAFFQEKKDCQVIGGYNLTHGDSKQQLRKIVRVHPFRDLPLRNVWVRNKLIVGSRHLLAWLGVRRSPRVRIGGKPCDVFFGSDYWALTPACARYVCEKLETERALVCYFRTAFVPSELCVQTIVYNSPFRHRACLREGSYPGLTALTPLHYISYGACVKQLDETDYPTLRASGKMFCRKVVSGHSDRLVAIIDAARAGG